MNSWPHKPTVMPLQVSLVAEVASNYFLLRDLDNELQISVEYPGRKEEEYSDYFR